MQIWSLTFRCVALVECIALCSLLPQLAAFGGTRGLQPAAVKFARARLHRGRGAWLSAPSLLWFAHSDVALHAWAVLGIAAALRAAWGGTGACACLLLANAVFLSFDPVVGLSMPWDCLLLEAGWISALLPPPAAGLVLTDATPVHPAAAFLVRWLLFRLMIGFGKLKFTGTHKSDALYVRDFMILQPMPSRLGWLAYCYMPHFVFRRLLGAMFFTELIAPWLLLLPFDLIGISDAPCRLAALLFVGLMGGINAHGSFGHFNLLTASLCLPLLPSGGCPSLHSTPSEVWALTTTRGMICTLALAFYVSFGLLHLPFSSGLSRGFAAFPQIDRWVSPRKRALLAFVRFIQPLRLIHSYGVFPPHTAPGLKILPVVEGSVDGGKTWRRYIYRHMLSSADSSPQWCAPHQPRLDYRMFYEGIGSTPDNLMAGTLALHEPYALSRAGMCDRLMQRLLEGDGPVSRLFALNPFEGTKPTLMRMITISLEPTPGGARYWRETELGVHRPPTAADTGVWAHFCDEPEVVHWDCLFARRGCAAYVGADGPDGIAPRSVTLSRPVIRYDGATLTAGVLEVSAADVEQFWKHVGSLRNGGNCADDAEWFQLTYSRQEQWLMEIILARLSAQLAARLAPIIWCAHTHPTCLVPPPSSHTCLLRGRAPGWPSPTQLTPPKGAPALASWWDMMLVCHHIILTQGQDGHAKAMRDPAKCIAAIWPDGAATWNVVEAVRTELDGISSGGGGHRGGERLEATSAVQLYMMLWWPVFQWHATKWRLCQAMCAPWQLAVPREGAGVLEMVALLVERVPAPGEKEMGRGECFGRLAQGEEDLLWRDETGRRIGFGGEERRSTSPARRRGKEE